jgi:hypothetical protein
MIKARMEGVIVNGESLFFQGKHVIAKLALERRLPSCVYVRELVEAGGLIAYQHPIDETGRASSHRTLVNSRRERSRRKCQWSNQPHSNS